MTEERVENHIIRPLERSFARRAMDWIEVVLGRSRPQLTDFLTPREQFLLGRMATDKGATVQFYGGAPQVERVRAILTPDDWPMEADDYAITVLGASFANQAQVSHGSVMGSILGTGIERRKVGDIAVFSTQALVCVCDDMLPHLLGEWTSIGRMPIAPSPQEAPDLWPEPLYVRDVIEVTALRADTVVAHACHLSRGKAQEAFDKKQVSLNYVELTDVDCLVAEGDIISIRGFGRVRIFGTMGQTKSGRIRLEVGVLQSSAR